MDGQEEVFQNNMISNLPLLFANGYPTSLDKISESQLEKFIPFMVQCSLGQINFQGQIDSSEPEWWPEDLPFSIPLNKPKKFTGNWMEKLKEVVLICYQFHKSLFLLRFCKDLSSYEHASLRFINNYNSTTSLFDRRSNKLLVTFRNENMSYDQPQRLRKCLLHQKSKSESSSLNTEQQMVEPAPFDIYLCDNCDAELYSKEAILEHEKTCMMEDDDVILLETPRFCDSQPRDENVLQDHIRRISFLLNLNLQHKYNINSTESSEGGGYDSCCMTSKALQEENQFRIIDKKNRMPRRNRTVHLASRCPTIPLSSPAGQLLLKATKSVITSEYLVERQDRIERFCHAPIVSKSTARPKFFEKKTYISTPHCTFKKPQVCSTHLYIFPRRQFSRRRRMENIFLINSTLLRRCRPISVRLKKMSDINNKLAESTSNKLNIKLTRDNSRSANWKISSCASAEIILDTIDLCTSDEEDNQKNRCASNISYVDSDSIQSGIISRNNSKTNSFALPTSITNIRKQLNFPAETFFNKSAKTLHNSIQSYNSATCLMEIVHKSENKNTHADTVTNFTNTFRPSLYILSNCSTGAPIAAIQNLSRSNETDNEKKQKSKYLANKLTDDGSGKWLISEHKFNIISNIKENSVENNDAATSNTLANQTYGNHHTLPLLFQKNRIISIDLTS